MLKIKTKRIYKTKKFFGFPGEPRNLGKYGKCRSYGHHSGSSDCRSKAELANEAEVLDILNQVEDLLDEF